MKTDTKLALKWGCDERSVRRWRRAGAPLTDPKAMRAWLSGQRKLPEGTAEVLARLRTQTAKEALPAPALAVGAGPALERLEKSEAQASAAYQRAIESGDAHAIKSTRQNWLEVCETLRRFDSQVVESKRTAGEIVPRLEVERIFHALAVGWSNGIGALADGFYEQFSARPLLQYDSGKVKETLWMLFAAALAQATVRQDLPAWVVPSITYGTALLDAEPKVAALAEVFRECVKMKVEKEFGGDTAAPPPKP